MKGKHMRSWSLVLVTCALSVGLIGGQAIALSQPDDEPDQGVSSTGVMQGGPGSFAALVQQVKPAVVNISIVGSSSPTRGPQGRQFRRPEFPQGSPFDEYFRDFFQGNPGAPRGVPDREFRAVGSGFVISADGLVVTNNHVIEQAEEIEVIMADGTRYSADVQGRDPKTDLALLKVVAGKSLPFVELGDSDGAQVGDWVLAVGNPFGLGGTVTAGIISARGRDIQAGPFDDFLQIDAPINRGNSGGPLFDASGRVIGINTAIYSPSGGSVGIGFAIPSTMAGEIIDALASAGAVERGFLGVQFQVVSDAVAKSLGLEDAKGALVANVVEDGPADRAGLRAGDVIVSLDGEPLDEPKDLPRLVAKARAGSQVGVEVLRDGAARQFDVEIGRSEPVELASVDDKAETPAKLGVSLSELTPEASRRAGVPQGEGVLVTDVDRGSPASRAGIRAGHVITMVGQTAVASPSEVVAEVDSAAEEGRPSVLLLVEERGGKRFVAVEFAA
jgi:serine protease Do